MSLIESNDVVLKRNSSGVFDISIDDDGDIETDNFLDTSLLRAIYAERRATESEIESQDLRRGWIGNEGKDFEDGSKVWLFEQERVTISVINGIKSEIENALEFLIEDRIAIDYEVNVSLDSENELEANIKIQRSSSKTDNFYYKLFDNSGQRNYAS